MAKKVKVDGQEMTVPDDITTDELDQLIKSKPHAMENLRGGQPAPTRFASSDAKTPLPDEQVAPTLGRVAAQVPPVAGSFWGPGGTMIGTGVSQALKSQFPRVFGEPADSVPLEGLKDLFVNNVIPSGIEKGVGLLSGGLRALPAAGAFKNFPATRQGAAQEMTKQILSHFQQPESQILEAGAGQASGNLATMKTDVQALNKANPPKTVVSPLTGQQSLEFHPTVQAAMKDLEDTFGKNKVGQKLTELQKDLDAGKDVAGSQTYNEISRMALSDLTHVRNWKLAAGEEGIQDLAINKLLQLGSGPGETLNSMKILSELTGKNKEIYSEAISPATLSSFKDLINEVHAQQAGHAISDAIVHYSKGRMVWASGLVGGIHGLLGLPGATAAGVTLTNSALARAMSNPETARIVVEAMRTPAMSQKGQMINQILTNLWKGTAAVSGTPER